FRKRGGTEVKTIGDAFLVEFPSAVEAVECAVEMQRLIEGTGEVRIRIGIHVGDIVHREGDVLGDAVNVAARVEPLAEPGGVCVTRQVVDQVERKVPYAMTSMGAHSLKNIGYPVEVFRLEMDGMNQPTAEGHDNRRLAILPFANLSADPNDRYFADGMTEELISTVSKIGELQVISRTSVMRYRDTTVPISQIGRELKVGSILEGSVRKSGNRLRITAQLILAQDDRHLWSESYDRDMTDVFAIQGDIAEQVASSLRVHLVEGKKKDIRKQATSNPEAHTLYLKGRYYWNERTEESLKSALRCFTEATKVDPGFAMAHSGMADCYSIMSDYGWMEPKEAGMLGKDEALKALELDDSLAEAHASLGLVLSAYDWDIPFAERELRKAVELKPNYTPAHHWLSIVLFYRKRIGEAYEEEKKAFELDPHSRIVKVAVANYLALSGGLEDAIRRTGELVDEYPDFTAARQWRCTWSAFAGDYENAMAQGEEYVSMDKGSWASRMTLGWIYAAAGKKDKAEAILADAKRSTDYIPPSYLATIEILLGQVEAGFDHLDRTFADKDTGIFYFNSIPWYDRFKTGPRWARIQKSLADLGVGETTP
ncbi:MAG TPA: adenylate/guanylate cyclase domain-containing protein, partial [Nitrososphaerales archaeon]|nr:adenylate/guanylate cyclase domain-containing protein [Nitrososphaerales archaeon]